MEKTCSALEVGVWLFLVRARDTGMIPGIWGHTPEFWEHPEAQMHISPQDSQRIQPSRGEGE